MNIRIELSEREMMMAVGEWIDASKHYKVVRGPDDLPKYTINAPKAIEATVWVESTDPDLPHPPAGG